MREKKQEVTEGLSAAAAEKTRVDAVTNPNTVK